MDGPTMHNRVRPDVAAARGAGLKPAVSQSCTRQGVGKSRPPTRRSACGLQTRDTAEFNSALPQPPVPLPERDQERPDPHQTATGQTRAEPRFPEPQRAEQHLQDHAELEKRERVGEQSGAEDLHRGPQHHEEEGRVQRQESAGDRRGRLMRPGR